MDYQYICHFVELYTFILFMEQTTTSAILRGKFARWANAMTGNGKLADEQWRDILLMCARLSRLASSDIALVFAFDRFDLYYFRRQLSLFTLPYRTSKSTIEWMSCNQK